jgi:hypothetical protein
MACLLMTLHCIGKKELSESSNFSLKKASIKVSIFQSKSFHYPTASLKENRKYAFLSWKILTTF